MSMKLNEKQSEAITSGFEPILVVAGAGSGKTSVLTQRIMYLIANLDFNPGEILAFTFTNKAANEIKKRVATIIPNFYFKWIGTFHSICLKILREDSHIINRANNFLVIDEDDQIGIIKEIYLLNDLSRDRLSIKKCLAAINKLKAMDLTDQEDVYHYLEKTELYNYRDIISVALIEYIKYLENKNYFDFDDLIKRVNDIFRKDSQTLDKWKARFSYILVDEFQDTNQEQFDLINFLVKDKKNIFVVGDPDQMIYSWRGAQENIFDEFKKKYSNYQAIILEQNYRSSQTILSVSNDLIKNNKKRIEKALYTKNSIGNKVIYFNAANQDNESKWIAERIDFLIKSSKNQYSDIAILYRSNYLSRNIEQVLFRRNIPYIVFGGLKFYRRKEIKDILSYLKYICVDDDVSLARIYNVPKRKFSANTYDALVKFAKKNNTTVHKTLINHLNEIDSIGAAAKNSCKAFNELIEKLKSFKYLTISDLIDYILVESKYQEYLDNEDENYRMENINELKNSINMFQQENPNATLYEFLQEVALYSESDEIVNDNNYVTLMTVHASKGLEFKNVFILGFNEEIFPSMRAIEEDGIEEERRIAYVAMTRSKENLFISSCNGINFQNNTQAAKIPSRFIQEISHSTGLEMKEENRFQVNFGNKNYYNNIANTIIQNNNFEDNYHQQEVFFEMGDTIMHKVFGKGIVLNVLADIIIVSFPAPIGKKSLSKNHKAIQKLLIN